VTFQLCPRCETRNFTPREERDVPREVILRYPYPALSRVADIDICSPCGQDEAMRDFSGSPPIPPDEWPIEVPRHRVVEGEGGRV
jgi:hypothetical protein